MSANKTSVALLGPISGQSRPLLGGVRTTALLLLVAAACTDAPANDYAGVVTFDTTSIRVMTADDTVRFHVELARSKEQRTMGLMERQSLADSAGMLFTYDADQPPDAGFWMFRTRIPLDIAFADSTGRIVAVRRMEPCPATLMSGCPSYDPGVPYRMALEVHAGVLARHGIGVGSQIAP